MSMHRNIFEEEHEIFRDSVVKFLQAEVTPNIDRWVDAGIVDRELFKKAGDQGYCLMWADEAYGGMGVEDFRFEQILIEENAFHGDAGFGLALHSRLCAPYIGKLGSEEQKQRFLPGCVSGETILGIAMTEPGAGSDVAGIRTTAVEQGDHWVLNGSKIYISNGINGDLFIVAAAPCRTIRTASGCSWWSAAWKVSAVAATSRSWA
jgi:alkylation response protein AidB-like acyl-CoA dehydrogenase